MTTENEATGPHHIVERTTHGWNVDVRAIVFGALFLVGGGAGGVTSNMLGGSGVREELAGLRASVDAMRTDMAVLKSEASGNDKAAADVQRRLEDHEKRLREIERGR